MAIVDQWKGRIMKIDAPGTLLTNSMGASDYRLHSRLHHEIVHRAGEVGMAGATVLRSIQAFPPVLDTLIDDGPVVRKTPDIILDRGLQPGWRGERA